MGANENIRFIIGAILIMVFPFTITAIVLNSAHKMGEDKVMAGMYAIWVFLAVMGMLIMPKFRFVEKRKKTTLYGFQPRYQCKICNQSFESGQALGGHRGKHKNRGRK